MNMIIDVSKAESINKFKHAGLQKEARDVLEDIKDRGIKIVDLMETTEVAEDHDNLAIVLGGLAMQATAIDMALKEGALTLEHKPLITTATATIKEIDTYFKPRKQNGHR